MFGANGGGSAALVGSRVRGLFEPRGALPLEMVRTWEKLAADVCEALVSRLPTRSSAGPHWVLRWCPLLRCIERLHPILKSGSRPGSAHARPKGPVTIMRDRGEWATLLKLER